MRNPPEREDFLHIQKSLGKNETGRGRKMKEDEKKLLGWEMVDPKPPVIQSGHFENRKQH